MSLDNDQLLARFAAEHYDRNSISLQRRQQSDALLRVLAARLGERTLVEMTPSDLMSWQGMELKRGIAPRTVCKRETMISSFIGWGFAAELISFEMTTRLKSVSGVAGGSAKSLPRPYKRAEIETFRENLAAKYPLAPATGKGSRMIHRYLTGKSPFLGTMRKHARRLQYEAQVSLALEEGLRSIELHSLTMAEVHHDNAAVVVRTAKSKPGQRRDREVPWTNHSRLCVREWIEFRALLAPGHESPWLTLRHYDPLSPQTMRHFQSALAVVEGGWRWHRFRHTFATERLRAGMPLHQLQVAMGHARLDQTMAYAEIVSADVRVESDRTEAEFERLLGLAA